MRNLEARVNKLESILSPEPNLSTWWLRGVKAGTGQDAEPNIFKFRSRGGRNQITSHPGESSEAFEARVRELTDEPFIMIFCSVGSELQQTEEGNH